MKRPMQVLLLAVVFDVYWTLVVLFRERGVVLWIALALLACLLLKPQLRINAIILAFAGGLLDVVWSLSGLIAFHGGGLLPLWMMALWLMYACMWSLLTSKTTLPGWILVLMASFGGPMAYFLGEALGAIVFLKPTFIVLSWMAMAWGILMLFFHLLARRS